tara:strand:+ start:132 stop:428 length:297 start_codon:yes stop_codon:yes gene_type:complete
MDENEEIIIILINMVSFMCGIFTGFGFCLKFNKNLPSLTKKNDIENIVTTHYPINNYASPQFGATAPPPSPIPLSLESAVIAEEAKIDINKREIIIKN